MQKNILVVLSAVAMIITPTAFFSQASNPSIIPVTTAPSGSCPQGLPNRQVISTGIQYSCQNISSGAGTWGSVSGNGVSTPTSVFYLDSNRTDSYTPNGSIQFPYKTLDQLSSGLSSYVSGGGTGPVAIWSSPNSSYSTSNATTFPAITTTIYGNNSTWSFSSGVTVNAVPITIYDLNTVGSVTYGTCSSTTRSERHGGSYSGGNVVFGAGCYNHLYGVNLSGNSYTATVNGLLYGEALTGSMGIVSGGTSSLIALYNPNITKTSGYNVDMTSGGQLLMNGGLLSTASGTANVYLPTANTTSTPHAISGLITGTGSGVLCASGTTTYLILGETITSSTYCTIIPVDIGSITITGGSSVVYRCTTAGTLPVGALTTATGNCGASSAVGIVVK